MTGQFELGSKHLENKKQAGLAISGISALNCKEAAKELYKKSYGLAPADSKAYSDYLGLAVVLEELAKSSPIVASLLAEQELAQELLINYGNENAKDLLNTNEIFAVLCSEPGKALFDSIETKASKTSNGWEISGKKSITKEQLNADKFIVFTKDENNNLELFAVSKDDLKLLEVNKNFAGTNLILNQAELKLEVSEKNHIGTVNDNYEKTMCIARTMVAAVSLGIGHSGLVSGINIAKEVKGSENQSLSNTQSMQFTLADMFGELEAARMLTYYSADVIDSNKPSIKFATMAKVQATDSASGISLQALQILGNLGYLANNDFADIMQVALNGQVKGGTNRTQKNLIYKYMLAGKK